MSSNSSSISSNKFQELLAKARIRAASETTQKLNKSDREINANLHTLSNLVQEKGIQNVELSSLAIGANPTDEVIVDTLREIVSSNMPPSGNSEINNISAMDTANKSRPQSEMPRISGVERKIILNTKQAQFCSTALSGRDCVLIGAAGTGKTTCQRSFTQSLIDYDLLPRLTSATKYLAIGQYGCVVGSFTRKAVNNIRRAVAPGLKANVMTWHKLLEFAPEFFEIDDPTSPGNIKKSMRFLPTRNAGNPLPSELTLLVHEESSMEGVDLYNLVCEAIPHAFQEIFLGDIQQLPPVFGPAILGYKMLEHTVIELDEVYRQGAGSPIIDLAWAILQPTEGKFSAKTETRKDPTSGKNKASCPALDVLSVTNDIGSVKFQIWQKTISSENALNSSAQQFIAWIATQYYNPEEDIILIPYNKEFGTVELNLKIAQHLGKKRNAKVYEVIAGFNKYYLAVGDRVLYDKEDAFITGISRNGAYISAHSPQPPSHDLDRWGMMQGVLSEEDMLQAQIENANNDLAAFEHVFNDMSVEQVTERTQSASHVITLRLAIGSSEAEDITIDSAAEVNNLLGGYAITVHKSQGSEYEKVFFVMHHSHAVMNSRELLYTACTRARTALHIICEPFTFERGVKSQKVKGNTIQEKAETFKGKLGKIEITSRYGIRERDMESIMAKYNNTGRTVGYDERELRSESRDNSSEHSTGTGEGATIQDRMLSGISGDIQTGDPETSTSKEQEQETHAEELPNTREELTTMQKLALLKLKMRGE